MADQRWVNFTNGYPTAADFSTLRGGGSALVIDTTTGLAYYWANGAIQVLGSGTPGNSLIGTPGGRLTLLTGTPVLTSDQTAKTTIFYTPYLNDFIPLYTGTVWSQRSFTELSLALDATNHVSGNLYDIFVWNNSGTIAIGTGPAWSSISSRGTGAGTTELQMLNGRFTNKNSITLKNGAGAGIGGISAGLAFYVGTFYATANGQTGMAFKPAAAVGGTNNILGLYNAYNRVRSAAMCRDSTTTWTYGTSTYRQANASNSNRISWVDGLGYSIVTGMYMCSVTGAAVAGPIGIYLDATSGTPNIVSQASTPAASTVTDEVIKEDFSAGIGFHFLQAAEVAVAGTVTFNANLATPTRPQQALTFNGEM